MKGELDLAVVMVRESYLWAMDRFIFPFPRRVVGPASLQEITRTFLIWAAKAPESKMLYVGMPGQAAQPQTFILFM